MIITPTKIGLILVIIGVIAWLAGGLKIVNLKEKLATTRGLAIFIFSALHILVGLMLIISDLLLFSSIET